MLTRFTELQLIVLGFSGTVNVALLSIFKIHDKGARVSVLITSGRGVGKPFPLFCKGEIGDEFQRILMLGI